MMVIWGVGKLALIKNNARKKEEGKGHDGKMILKSSLEKDTLQEMKSCFCLQVLLWTVKQSKGNSNSLKQAIKVCK